MVLNALTTWAAGFAAAISSAADIPGLVSSVSKVEKSTGLQVSTTVTSQGGALVAGDTAALGIGHRER